MCIVEDGSVGNERARSLQPNEASVSEDDDGDLDRLD